MNEWGVAKLGFVVSMGGALAVLGSGRSPFKTGAVPRTAAIQSSISGASEYRYKSSLGSSGLRGLGAIGGGGGGSFEAEASAMAAAAKAVESPAPSRQRAGVQPQGVVRKIVRTASLCFEVKDQAKARALVHGVVIRNGAEIFSEESSGSGDNESGTIVIQAAPEKLDAIIRELEPLGRVISRSVSAENMSEEYVDLTSRLKNYEQVERRLTELMQFKTNKLADVLALEQQLERVGQEIEEAKGRMKYIDALAANSKITVRMAQPAVAQAVEAAQAQGILAQVRNSLVGSFNTFVSTGLSLLSMTGFVLALALWTLPVAGGLWLIKKKIWSEAPQA